jgi:hypothetical protein
MWVVLEQAYYVSGGGGGIEVGRVVDGTQPIQAQAHSQGGGSAKPIPRVVGVVAVPSLDRVVYSRAHEQG